MIAHFDIPNHNIIFQAQNLHSRQNHNLYIQKGGLIQIQQDRLPFQWDRFYSGIEVYYLPGISLSSLLRNKWDKNL